MNKKLFSWKALAGFALLVAMGLTSCNQSTVVDPTDPYGSKTPTQPSATVKDANVSVTITKTSDFATQWSSKVTAAVLAELAKKNEVTIEINCAAYELDGAAIDLPTIWASANGKTLNVIFKGNFKKAEKDLVVTTSKVSGAVVNFTLPATKFGFNLDAATIVANLASEGATLDKFTAKANTGKNATTIGSGVTVAAIVPQGGDFVGTVNSVYYKDVNPVLVSKKGININQTTENIVKNLIADGSVYVAKDGDTELGDIVVLKGGKLTVGTIKAIASITGTKPSETELTLASVSDVAKIGSIKNMKITNTALINFDKAVVDNVEFAGPVELASTTISGATFDDWVQINVDGDNKTYTFSGVSFASTSMIYMESTLKQSVSKSTSTYFWDINAGQWVEVTATTPNIYAADKQVKLDVSQDASNVIYSVTAGALSSELAKLVSATTNTISITTIWYDNLAPKGAVVALNGCKQGGAAVDGEYLTNLFGAKWSPSACWFKVSVDGTMYAWKELATGGYILVKE